MYKVLNGRRYNTQTAKRLGTHGDYLPGDVNSSQETLYRTKSGEYFIHGEGGANTRYAKAAGGGGWTDGEHIAPISAENARQWVQEHLSGDDYDRIFGDAGIVDAFSIRVSKEMRAKIEKKAKKESTSMSKIVNDALEKYFS